MESDGDIAEGYRYVEWGQTTIVDSTFAKLTTTEGDTKNNVRYTGRDQYTALGDNVDTWYNNRARALRTKWGRFVQRDPRGYQDGSNRHLYVAGDPLSFTDPMGATILQGGGHLGQAQAGRPEAKKQCEGITIDNDCGGSFKCTFDTSKTVQPGDEHNCGEGKSYITITVTGYCEEDGVKGNCEPPKTHSFCEGSPGATAPIEFICNGKKIKLDLSGQPGSTACKKPADKGGWGGLAGALKCNCVSGGCTGDA